MDITCTDDILRRRALFRFQMKTQNHDRLSRDISSRLQRNLAWRRGLDQFHLQFKNQYDFRDKWLGGPALNLCDFEMTYHDDFEEISFVVTSTIILMSWNSVGVAQD